MKELFKLTIEFTRILKNLKGTIKQLLKAKQKYKAESERWMGKFYTQYPKSKLET